MTSSTIAFVLVLTLGANAKPMEDAPLEEGPRSPRGFSPAFKVAALTDEAPIEIPDSVRLTDAEVGDEKFDYDPDYYDDYGLVSFPEVDEEDSEASASEASPVVVQYDWEDQSLCGLKLYCESHLLNQLETGDIRNPSNNFILASAPGNVDYQKEKDNSFNSEYLRNCAEAIAKCSLSGEDLSRAFLNGF